MGAFSLIVVINLLNRVMMSLEDCLVEECPSTVYYMRNFITEEQEQELVRNINGAPQPKWVQLSNRRLQNWGGIPHAKGMIQDEIPKWLQKCIDDVFSATSLVFPQDKKPNHVLVNEYEAHQGIMPHLDGPLYYPVIATISLQSSVLLDLYSQNSKSSAINELQSDDVLIDGKTDPKVKQFGEAGKDSLITERIGSVMLEPRSLYIATDEVYFKYLHGIREDTTYNLQNENVFNIRLCSNGDNSASLSVLERSKRMSITIRHVPKVLKNKLFIR